MSVMEFKRAFSGAHRVRAALLLLGVCLALPGAGASSPPVLALRDAWVRWVPAVVPNTALYGVLVNDGEHDVELVGATTEVAKMCQPMITVKKDTGSPSGPELSMEPVDALVVPAHGSLTLEPGGDHLMIMGLSAPLEAGAQVQLTLRFAGADPLTVTVPVAAK